MLNILIFFLHIKAYIKACKRKKKQWLDIEYCRLIRFNSYDNPQIEIDDINFTKFYKYSLLFG